MFNEQHIYIGGVVVSGHTLSAVDYVFEHWLGENEDHKIDCLMPLSTIFQLYRGGLFYFGGENHRPVSIH
jgi:hypothetical protein